MIVITGYQRVGTLMQNCDILRATSFQILPIARDTNGLSSQQLEDEQAYVLLIESHLKKNGFYFSYRYNLTLSVQRQAQVQGDPNNWREVRERERGNVCIHILRHILTTRRIQDSFGIIS